MASLQAVNLAHLPAENILYIALFKNVSNAEFLRQQLLNGNADFEYAFIDAKMVRYRQ